MVSPSWTRNWIFYMIIFLYNKRINVVASDLNKVVARKCNTTIASHQETEGTVTSPGYPNLYPRDLVCTFTFLGTAEQRIQLIFTQFYLPEAKEKKIRPRERCLHADSLAVYNINNNTVHREIDRYCGNSVPFPVMSSQSGLHIIFKSSKNNATLVHSPSDYGFSLQFKFVTNFGMLSGHQPTPGICKFIYNSRENPNGTIFSPNPEGFYPQDTTCLYIFQGRPGEILRLIFKYFDIEGILPCDGSSDSDYLEFSNFPSADRKIPHYCGTTAPRVLQSDASFFRVIFRSNDKFDGTGFAADYQFLDMSRQPYMIRRVVAVTGGSSSS